MAHEFCWVELTTEDAGTARSFYTGLFDWTYDDFTMQNGGIYGAFQPSCGPGGGIMAKPMPECPTAWMPYVAVEDLDSAVARARELGGTVLVDPTPVPDHGTFAVVADPTGAAIGLWRNNESSD